MKRALSTFAAWVDEYLFATMKGSPKIGRMIEKPNVSIMRRTAWRTRTNSSNLRLGHHVFQDFNLSLEYFNLKEQGDSTTNIVLGQEKKKSHQPKKKNTNGGG